MSPDSTVFATGSDTLLCNGRYSAYGGCNIGGSSSINAGLFFEPPASDWDTFHPTGWKAADVAPAIARLYRRQPTVTSPSATTTSAREGRFYPPNSGYDAAKRWLVDGAGYAEVASLNAQADRKTHVFGPPQYDYTSQGQRGGPVTTYLQSALARPNFRLQSNVTVRRVLRTGATATGVLASVPARGGGVDVDVPIQLTTTTTSNNTNTSTTTTTTTTTGRVILSGGAIFSPSLLMHSGIGPADVLTTLAHAGALDAALATDPSAWLNNSAVGARLFDNPNTYIELSGPSVEAYTYRYQDPAEADRTAYLRNRTGPYAFAGQTSVFWTYLSHGANGSSNSSSSSSSSSSRTGVQGTMGTAGSADFTNGSTITLNVYGTSGLLSTGHVVLTPQQQQQQEQQQQDPATTTTTNKKNVQTVFIPGPSDDVYYSDAEGRDADDIAQFIHDLFSVLKSSGAGLTPLNLGVEATKDEIKRYITTPSKYAVGAVQHWSSSCRIGPCVDAETRVLGMANLHVVDASILAPLTVNPQFGVMVAGERGAELIKGLDGREGV